MNVKRNDMEKVLIKGKENIGKTTFLKNLYTVLLKLGATEESKKQVGKDENDFISFIKFDSKKICINTAGDQVNFICDAVKESRTQNCDMLLSACRSDIYDKTTFPDKRNWKCLDAEQKGNGFHI